jgi:hypothetical protein
MIFSVVPAASDKQQINKQIRRTQTLGALRLRMARLLRSCGTAARRDF